MGCHNNHDDLLPEQGDRWVVIITMMTYFLNKKIDCHFPNYSINIACFLVQTCLCIYIYIYLFIPDIFTCLYHQSTIDKM